MGKRSRQVYIDDKIWQSGRMLALKISMTMSAYVESLIAENVRMNEFTSSLGEKEKDEPHKTS